MPSMKRKKKDETKVMEDLKKGVTTTAAAAAAAATTTARKKAMTRTKKKRLELLRYEEVPEYLKDNEFILDYYRADWPLWDSLLSIFCWHNETLNIWTHLIGFVIFLGLTVANLMQLPQFEDFFNIFSRSFSPSQETNAVNNSKDFFTDAIKLDLKRNAAALEGNLFPPGTVAARWPFFVYLGGAIFCFLSSSICHLFSCHSHQANLLLLRIDYVGITVMIVTSFFPPIFYIFQCQPHWQLTYLAAITGMGVFTVVTLFSPCHSSPAHRCFRALLFLAMGLSAIVPAIHAVIANWSDPRCLPTLGIEATMAVAYVVGTLFYVSRVPERWRPGCFDLAGHSHQIFHMFVILGALAHYMATLTFMEWRDSVGCDQTVGWH